MPWSTLTLSRHLWSLVACLTLFSHASIAQTRHALIVGIDQYANVEALQKAQNDARAVHSEMELAGFESTLLLNADQIGFLTAISAFANRVQPGDDAVFFFAGHGVEVAGANYLLPSDVPKIEQGQELVLTSRAIAVNAILESLLGRGARVSLLILDACRDNPFSRGGKRSVGGTRGLARASPTEGSFILYSAGEGETALDRLSETDSNPNSVFTRSLLKVMSVPGIPIRDLAQKVRSETRSLAYSISHEQFPAVYDQLDGDFIFLAAAKRTDSLVPSTPKLAEDPCLAAQLYWQLLEKSDSISALNAFVAQNGTCPVITAFAKDRIASLGPGTTASKSVDCAQVEETWSLLADVDEINTLRKFLVNYPDCGNPSVQARARLDKLEALAEEKALSITPKDIGQIRLQIYWSRNVKKNLLYRKKGSAGFLDPDEREVLGSMFFRGLLDGGRDIPTVRLRYLTRDTVAQLLARPLNPKENLRGQFNVISSEMFGRWRANKSDQGCFIYSDYQSISSLLVPDSPQFYAASWKKLPEGELEFSFADPNIFPPGSKVTAEINGKTFKLNSMLNPEGPQLKTYSGNGRFFDNGVLVAMKSGRTMTIKGTNSLTQQPIEITYDLKGFTAAFTRMSKLCNSSKLMDWLR